MGIIQFFLITCKLHTTHIIHKKLYIGLYFIQIVLLFYQRLTIATN